MSRLWEKLASWSLREWITSSLAAGERPIYAAAYTLSKNATPLDFKSYPGLIATKLLDDAKGEYLVTYWSSKGAYDDHAHRIDAGEDKDLIWAHYVRETTVPKQPIWRRLKPYQLFIHAAALGGAFLTLGTCWSTIAQTPNVLVTFQADDLNQLAQSEGEVELVVSSMNGEVKTVVEDLKLTILNKNKEVVAGPIDSSLSTFTLIAERDVRLDFSVPPLDAGKYKIVANLTMNSGFLRGSKTTDFTESYALWNRGPDVQSVKVDGVGPLEYQLRSKLAVGKPQAVHCQATLISIPVEDVSLSFPGNLSWDQDTSDDGDVLVVKWSAEEVQPFEWLPFVLRVRTSQKVLTEDFGNVQIDCQEKTA